MSCVPAPGQPALEAASEPDFDRSFSSAERIQLDASSWVDYAPRWVSGSDTLFAKVLERVEWGQRTERLSGEKIADAHLTSSWRAASGDPLEPEILERMRLSLSERYGVEFQALRFNLYRDGGDSVGWHRDRIAQRIPEPVVALVSLGDPRKFQLRPHERMAARERTFMLGHGDLLVTGGASQQRWEHGVPKVAEAGPRISIGFRHGPGGSTSSFSSS